MRITLFWITLLGLSLFACGGGEQTAQDETSQEETSTTETEATEAEATEETTSEEEAVVGDEDSFVATCGACHQADGSGVPGLYPPLNETEWVTGEKERLIKIVLQGLEGEIEVNGEKYNQVMAALGYLEDDKIAGILTYVRHKFGNGADAVTTEEVAAVRASLEE